MPTVKLLVSYHKPDVLLKDDILTPINAGRALAKQRLAEGSEELAWLLANTIGDDTGDNISEKNAGYNEMTSVYWAWKNYAELGNPDYIGFMHYRRHFLFRDGAAPQLEVTNLGDDDYLADTLGYSPAALEELVTGFDFVYTRPLTRNTVRDHFAANHHIADLDLALQVIQEKYPEIAPAAEEYLSGKNAIFCNMFIMPKQIFFDYASFVFDVLFEVETRGNMAGKRMFISEWITGIYLTYLISQGKKPKTLPIVIAEGPHVVPIAMAADANYVKPTSVALVSILENAGRQTSYDIYILVPSEYPDDVKKKLLSLEKRYPGTRISFIVAGPQFAGINTHIEGITVPTYYRLILPSALPQHKRCIYLDGDLVAEADLTPLLRTVVDDKYLAGVPAASYHVRPQADADKIGLPAYDRYVNAGVLLMNLDKMRAENIETEFMKLAAKGFESDDQDVLNVACYDGIRVLPLRFNLMTKYFPASEEMFFAHDGVKQCWTRTEYRQAVKKPVIIHYADKRKPWLDTSADFAERWWHYAMLSPFRDEILDEYLTSAVAASRAAVLDLLRKGQSFTSRQTKLGRDFRPEEIFTYQKSVLASVRLTKQLDAEKEAHLATKKKLATANKKLAAAEKKAGQLTRLQRSRTYRMARMITWLPRAIRRLGRR
jgi:lipopolysaccharide biosynthesis glycosyltransferase